MINPINTASIYSDAEDKEWLYENFFSPAWEEDDFDYEEEEDEEES